MGDEFVRDADKIYAKLRNRLKNDPEFAMNRFTVHINKTGKSVASTKNHHVNIFGNSDGINVTFGYRINEPTAQLTITNLAGQIFYSGTVQTDEPFLYPVNDNVSLYLVHVVTGSNVTYNKVLR